MAVSCVEEANGNVRGKLSYLFAPTPLRHRESEQCPHQKEQREIVPQEPTTELPSVLSCDISSSVVASQLPKPALGTRSSRCDCCHAESVREDRVFAELNKVYCERCWSQWERCGRWHPTMRVCTAPPTLGESGLPEFDAEDAFVLPAFICSHDDLSLMERLRNEVPEEKKFSDWHGARHLALHFEGEETSKLRSDAARPALRETILQMEAAFGIKASAVRLNLYRSNADYKPFHADRGRDDNGLPQCTVGLSLGATRELSFAHYKTGVTMTFPQRNGDVFAFTPELNKVFLHGVPRVKSSQVTDEPRISLILWGSRLALLESSLRAS